MGSSLRLRTTALAAAAYTAVQNMPRAAAALNFVENLPDATSIELDLVGLLTVIGEAAMALHVQCITVSWLCLLPRIIPAPQAFLSPNRPAQMKANKECLSVGIYSGNLIRQVHYFADQLLDPESVPPYVVREVRITHRAKEHRTRRVGRLNTMELETRYILARHITPLSILAWLGFFAVLGLLAFAIQQADSMAITACGLLALTSTLTGAGSWWNMKLLPRDMKRPAPRGSYLIRNSKGGFIVAWCNEEVARELFTCAEECEYVLSQGWFRVCAGSGTLSLMAAVVALANCTWACQAAFAGVYLLFNALYWFAAILPTKWNWDTSLYQVEEEHTENCRTYTKTLWHLISKTRTAEWGKRKELVPNTKAWNKWLELAEQAARGPNAEEWPYGTVLEQILREHANEVNGYFADLPPGPEEYFEMPVVTELDIEASMLRKERPTFWRRISSPFSSFEKRE